MKKAEEANAYYNKQPAKMNVYDAGESVQNMPVKKTEESHKQCTPCEFGVRVKESVSSDGLLGRFLAGVAAVGGAGAALKFAADPRATDETGGAYSPLGRQDLLNRIDGIAATVNGPSQGRLYGSSSPQAYGMDYSPAEKRWVSNTERNHAYHSDRLQHNIDAYKSTLTGLKNESNSAAQLGTAASMGLNAAGNAIGAPALAGAANMGLTGLRAADSYARNYGAKRTQQNLNTARQNLQQFKQPWEGQQKLSPAATPKPVTPTVKANSAREFGVKVADNFMGFNYNNVGPGGIVRERTLPQPNPEMNKMWQGAKQPTAQPTAQPAAQPPMKPMHNMLQAHPGLKAIPPGAQQNMLNRMYPPAPSAAPSQPKTR
jgi:hypothetical protein